MLACMMSHDDWRTFFARNPRRNCHSQALWPMFCLSGTQIKSREKEELGVRKACDIFMILCVVPFAKLKPWPSRKAMKSQRN